MTRESTASLLSGNVEYSNEIKNELMIEGYVKKKTIWKLKDNCFLWNDVEIILYYKPIEYYMEKRKYEKAFSECKTWSSLIKGVVGRNITVISKK